MSRILTTLATAMWAVMFLTGLLLMPLAAQDGDGAADADASAEDADAADGEDDADADADDEPAGDAPTADLVILAAGPRADLEFGGFQKGKLEFAGGFGGVKVDPGDLGSIRLKGDAERTMYLKDEKRSESREVRVLSRGGKLYYYNADESADAARELDYSSIFRISGDPIPVAKWTGSIAAAFSIGRGNTEDVTAGINADLKRETNIDALSFHYEFGYTETDVNNVIAVSRRYHEGFVEYRFFLSEAWSLFAKNTLRNDTTARLEYRNTTDLGGSWKAISEDDTSLGFDLSVNHTFEREFGSAATNYMGGTAALDFKTKLGDPMIFQFPAKISEDFDNTDNWIATLKAILTNDLGEGFSLGFVAEMTYDNVPATGARQTDFRLTAILGWTFEAS